MIAALDARQNSRRGFRASICSSGSPCPVSYTDGGTRRFPAAPTISIFYLVESPDVLTSKPYLGRLDNPTAMTRKIMSEVFLNATRTVCRRTLRSGGFRGAFAVTARFLNDAPDPAALARLAEDLVQDAAIAACEIWEAVDPGGQPVSMEEQLRGGDKKIRACLMVDTLRQADAEKIGAGLSRRFSLADVGVFRVLCQLGRADRID
jgi:hypothetical protein